MSKEHHVIYLPGLGDQRTWGQSLIVKCWQIFGITAHYHKIGWANNEPFELKLKAVVDKIDSLANQGFLVSLVGISVGASAALNAYVLRQDKVHKVVFISGKIRHPENVNPRYFEKNPAFKQALDLSEANFQKLTRADKQKMIYLHGLYDRIVSPRFDEPAGIRSRAVLAFGHVPSILVAITLYAGTVAKFIKS